MLRRAAVLLLFAGYVLGDVPPLPLPTLLAPPNGALGVAYNQTVAAPPLSCNSAGQNCNYTSFYILGGAANTLPPGLTLAPQITTQGSTLALTGTPTQAGFYTGTITVFYAYTGVNLGGGQQSAQFTYAMSILSGTPLSLPPKFVFRDQYGAVNLYEAVGHQVYNGGGVFASDPAAAQNATGDTYVAARDGSGSIWFGRFTTNLAWQPWINAAGIFQGVPAIAVNNAGTALIVARDRSNAYWAAHYIPGSGLTGWKALNGIFGSDPGVAAVGQAFYITGRDQYNTVWLGSYDPTLLPTPFTGWRSIGGVIQGKPAIAAGPNGPVIAVRDTFNNIWVYWVTPFAHEWYHLTGTTGTDPKLINTSPTTVELVILDPTSVLWYRHLLVTVDFLQADPWVNTGGVFADFAAAPAPVNFTLLGRDFFQGLWSGLPWEFLGRQGLVQGAISGVTLSGS